MFIHARILPVYSFEFRKFIGMLLVFSIFDVRVSAAVQRRSVQLYIIHCPKIYSEWIGERESD